MTSTESSSTETVHKQARQQVKTVTISIECATLIGHTADVKEAKRAFVPQSGVILAPTTINLNKGDSVYDILVRATKKIWYPDGILVYANLQLLLYRGH